MTTVKSRISEPKQSLKIKETAGNRIKVLEIIWQLILAIFIILVWFYSGKDYEDEEKNENIAVTAQETGDIR